MKAFRSGLPVRAVLALVLVLTQVQADCELCTNVTTEPKYTFEIDGFVGETDGLAPFIRMEIEREKGKDNDPSDGFLNITVNMKNLAYYGCYTSERRGIVKHMGDVNVTLMSRPLFNKSDKCIGFGQTSVRLARIEEGLIEMSEDSTVEVKWEGPSQMKEVCVGMEGGNCTIRGNGESHRRCFVRPTMEDGCEVRTLHDGQTVVVTSQRRNGSVWNVSDSLTLSDLDEVYVGSVKDDILVSVSGVRLSTMVEVMSAEKGSDKRVTLVDTSNTTLNLAGRGNQIAKVSAVGDTFLSAFIFNDYRKNRITVNARCSQGLDLKYFIQDHITGDNHWNRWSQRVGCPSDPYHPCKITDLRRSQAKHVIIASKEAWLDDLIDVTGDSRRSFISAFAAFYTSEIKSDECCFEDLCEFEKQCILTSNGGRSFTYNELCNSFVLSFYVPFVHIITAVVYLICVGSLLMLVSRDDRIQSSRNIKYLIISLLESCLFAIVWITVTVMYVILEDDMFSDLPNLGRRSVRFLYLFPIAVHCIIAADSRILQVYLVNEIHDRELQNKGIESWRVYHPKLDICLYGWGFRLIGWSLLTIPVTFHVAPIVTLSVGMFLVFISVIRSMFSSLPDFGFIVSIVMMVIVVMDGVASPLFIFMAGSIAAHFWNFALIWGLVFRFAYGSSVMTNGKKAAFLVFMDFLKIVRMFTQVFDVITDWIIIGYFFADGSFVLGFTESSFVLSAVAVSAYFEWDSFPHWWQRVITLMGLGRIVQIIDTSVILETRTFLEEAETHLESLPSVFLGMIVVVTAPREETGPVLFSMGVTWFSLFLRALGTVMKLKFPALWKCLIFLTLFSDFFVRCVSPALIIAVIQGQNGESPKVGSILFLLLYFVTVLLAYMLYYHSFYSGAVSRSPFYLRAMISTISVRCALFAYLRMDHYKHDAVIATPLDLAVLTIPHCLLSLVSSICCGLLWNIFPGLSLSCLIFTLIQMGCVTAMCNLSKDGFVSVDADQFAAKRNPPTKIGSVTSMSDAFPTDEGEKDTRDSSDVDSP